MTYQLVINAFVRVIRGLTEREYGRVAAMYTAEAGVKLSVAAQLRHVLGMHGPCLSAALQINLTHQTLRIWIWNSMMTSHFSFFWVYR